MRTLIPRHSRSVTTGEAPIFGEGSIPVPPSTIQTPDGTVYVSQELSESRQTTGILLGAAGGALAGVLGTMIARHL